MSPGPDLLPLLYDSASTGGWTHGMVEIVKAVLRRVKLPPAATILEVGCGSGAVLRGVRTLYPAATSAGVDLHPLALAYAVAAEPVPAPFIQGDLLRLPVADASCDLLLALDSFDQSGIVLGEALAEARRALKPGALLLLRVSAHPWLQGEHDVAFNTERRYAGAEIAAALRDSGYDPLFFSYANSLLAPPVIALRLLQRFLRSTSGSGVYASPLANRAVRLALELEAGLIQYTPLPFGLSLLALARKRPAP